MIRLKPWRAVLVGLSLLFAVKGPVLAPALAQDAEPAPASPVTPRAFQEMRASHQHRISPQSHVLHYNPEHLSVKQFAQDLPLLQPFIHLTDLRLILTLEDWHRESQELRALIQAIQKAGYGVELVLKLQQRVIPAEQWSQFRALKLSALSLQAPTTVEDWPTFAQNYRRLYQVLKAPPSHINVGLWVSDMPSVLRIKQALQSKDFPRPDLYLYHFKGPLHDLHPHVLRLRQHFKSPWQLAQLSISSPPLSAHHREHEEAWFYRFLFYFSKKYAPLPAAVSLFPTPVGQSPALLRSATATSQTDLRTPAYWLAHIYFHLNRIDIDEYKLTRALYTPIAAEDALHPTPTGFFKVYYKQVSEPALPDYISHKRSDLFYDFLKRETEESLLNSHFARLQGVRVPRQEKPALLPFLSALGRFRFLQRLRYEPATVSPKPEITGVNPPTLAADFQAYEKIPASSLPWISELAQGLKETSSLGLELDASLLRPLGTLSDTASFSQALFLKLRKTKETPQQSPAFPVDIQPLALQENITGRVFIPDPLFFMFLKGLYPEDFEDPLGVRAVLPFPESEHGFRLHLRAEKARKPSPRRLDVRTRLNANASELLVTLKNPFVERLFLPGLLIIAEQDRQLFVLKYVLPEGLLPLERREYSLSLPPQFQARFSTVWSAQSVAYAVIDREINLDDAYRSDVFGLPVQALDKYTAVFEQFAPELSSNHRLSVAERIVALSVQRESPTETEQRFRQLMDIEPETLFSPQDRVALTFARVRAYLQQEKQSPALIKSLAQDLNRLFADASLKSSVNFTLEEYKLWAYMQSLTGDSRGLNAYRKALSLALAQQNMPEINFLYERLSALAQAQGNDLQASRWLLSWRNHPAYASVPPARQQEHLKRLGYLAERRGLFKAALRYYRLYFEATGSIDMRLHLAQLYRKQGDFSAAILNYREYLKACQSCHTEAYRALAYLLEGSSPREAITYYERYLAQIRPTSDAVPEIRRALVNLYFKQGRLIDLQKAERMNRQLLQGCQRQCAESWQLQGAILGKQGRDLESLKAYERALQYTFSRSLLKKVVYLALAQEQETLALQRLKQLIPLTSGNEQTRLRLALGEIYRSQGRQDLLRDLLNPFLRGEQSLPRDPESVIAIAQLYQSIGATAPAIAALESTMTTSSKPYQYRLLASLYREVGKLEQATLWLERLKSRFPQENTLPLFKPYPLRTPAPRRPPLQGP